MRIWVFASGEPLPSATRNVRLLRAGNLCRYLMRAGHEVVWWTSSFDHIRKAQIGPSEVVQGMDGLEVRLLRSPGYRANLGLARLLDHAMLGVQFRRQALRAGGRPDVIWCSYPPIESALAAVSVGKRLGVPVVLDVRDLWPDVFLDVLPPRWGFAGRVLLYPYFKAGAHALENANGIVGVTEPYLQWALERAGRARRPLDRVFPIGYPDFDVPTAALRDADAFWRKSGVCADAFNICFFGTLGRQFDIATVLGAAALLQQRGSTARFIFCGQGSGLAGFLQQAAGLRNVFFAGHVDVPEIKALMDISVLGLAPYQDTQNFQLNLPNKIFEYAAGSLPVLSAVDGEVGRFVREHDTGYVYPACEPSALASMVMQLEGQREMLRQQGARARSLFSARFEAGVVSARIEAYLRELSDDYRGVS